MWKLLCWFTPAIATPLPCLNSAPDCLNQLTESATAQNLELTAIDDRLELVARQLDRQYERRWTALLPAIGDLIDLNPLRLIETLFGGGSFRDVDLKMADLELRVSDLMRQRAAITVQLHDEVTELVLLVERSDRQIALLRSQLESHEQRLRVMEISYRLGNGSTAQMIGLWQQRENLVAKLTEAEVSREQSIQKLLELTGYEVATSEQMDPADGDRAVVTGGSAALESRSGGSPG